MNIYVMDCGWRGSILAVAENEAQAREFMRDSYNYDEENELEVLEYKPGLLWVDMGDC
jgi:hypothetical protein